MSWNPGQLCDFVTDNPLKISYNISINQIMTLLTKGDFEMKRNMSNLDRIIRVLLAALFAYLYFGGIVTGILGIVLVVLAAVFLLTSIVAFCPLYTPFKFSTYRG